MSVEIRTMIKNCITSFKSGNLSKNAISLFNCLGYNTERQAPFDKPTKEEFKQAFVTEKSRFDEKKAKINNWEYVDLLFQLSNDEIRFQSSLFDGKHFDKTIFEAYLFFIIELKVDVNEPYSRSDLSKITREVNKLFLMPVMVLFKVGNYLTLSVINRRPHKRDDNRDVLQKITLIKDISIEKPHAAHLLILQNLSFEKLSEKEILNLTDLHNEWQKVLDTKVLNDQFYQKLSNWYFWAKEVVQFPDDIEKDKDLRNATQTIRLITRIIFLWFIREKALVADEFFDAKYLSGILKEFDIPATSDKTIYYKAILQNLFFATLSTKKEERKFRSKEWKNGHNIDFKNQYVYRYEEMVQDIDKWKCLFNGVPFLNGGLFENLDNKKNKTLVDGFSEEKRNCLHVPDYLFFSGEKDSPVLNNAYGTNGKKYKVKGLLEILDEYKFTITENTPIEEEVALDPELLGKVFEKLLASFNPETRTTARNRTGSFYTPREIVNYMVEESLKIALTKKVTAKMPGLAHTELTKKFDILFAYTDKEPSFTRNEIKSIVESIAELTIIDPACGSGAFPMGVLHKLVYILEKLDNDNLIWRELQKKKAIEDTEDAFDLGESSARHARLKEIEDTFNLNTSDYGRKLYLIENAIYGVDVQPIAVQIAKLRFFISLIVEQNTTGKVIKPLPNLETKFVAADTLVGKIKQTLQTDLFHNKKIDELEKRLENIRHNHFRAQSPQEKEQLRELDREIRDEMVKLLREEDPSNKDLAAQLSGWDPYNQNHNATFFDARWMYGTTDHFDIVIGNPPYIQIQNFAGKEEQKNWEKQNYASFTKTGDIYCLFYEKGNTLLKEDGILCFITSNKWMRANYGCKLRKYFVENTNPRLLIDFGSHQIFESATVDTNILFFESYSNNLTTKGSKGLKKDYRKIVSTEACAINDDFNCEPDIVAYVNKNKVKLNNLTEDSWLISSNEESEVKKRIEKIGIQLKDWNISIYRGVLTGLNDAFIIDGKKKDILIAEDPKSSNVIRPLLLGRDIKRYKIEFEDLWLLFIPWHFPLHEDSSISGCSTKAEKMFQNEYPAIYSHLLQYKDSLSNRNQEETGIRYEWYALQRCAASYFHEFEKDMITWGNLALSSQFAVANANTFINAPSPLITPANKYLLAVLNSKLGDYYIRSLGVTRSGGYFEYKPMFVEKLPVPQIDSSKQHTYEILVDYILFCKTQNMDAESLFFETIIDGLVYELYFEKELAAAKCEILKYLPDLQKFTASMVESKKKKIVEECYTALSDPNHSLSKSLFKLETVKEVQIIEGKV